MLEPPRGDDKLSEEAFVAGLHEHLRVFAIAFFWGLEGAEEVFVVIIRMVGAVPFAALFAEAFNAEVVVVFAGERAFPRSAFQQALR